MKKIPGAMSAARFLSILAIGASLTMAQQPAGTLRGWGSNGDGELADGLTGDSPVPQSVQNLTDVIAVASGVGYTLAVKSDGSVWAWGTNGNGELGNGGPTGVPQTNIVPTQVIGLGSGSGVIAQHGAQVRWVGLDLGVAWLKYACRGKWVR
jgi:Regulator of chromosome condensation (RCC1) repeat